MIRVDGFYLYSVGSAIHPLSNLSGGETVDSWRLPLLLADNALDMFLSGSVYKLHQSRAAGTKLLNAIRQVMAAEEGKDEKTIDFFEAYSITSALTEFEHVLTSEFGTMNLFFADRQRGYDTNVLVWSGAELFPAELAIKVPGAVADLNAAGRCIAFDLPTAAGFHLHRANESVLRRYYDAVSSAPRKDPSTMGELLAAMDTQNVGDKRVKAALRDIKDLHRNPLVHPEQSLESIDEAIALLGGIQAAVVPMLAAIPLPTSAPVTPTP